MLQRAELSSMLSMLSSLVDGTSHTFAVLTRE